MAILPPMWFLIGCAVLLYVHYRLDKHFLGNEAQNHLDRYRLSSHERELERIGIVSLRSPRKFR